MKNLRSYLPYLFVFLLAFGGCNKDDEPVSQAEMDLVGTWTAKEFSVQISVDNTPFTQWVQTELGLSDTELQDFIDLFVQGLGAELSGTIEFKSDKTYSAKFGSDPEENGTWILSNGDKTLTITDNGNSESTEMEVKTLNATTLVVSFDQTEMDDLDGDGSNETLAMTLELTFEK